MTIVKHIYQSLPSTNEKALELGQKGAGHGVVVQAESQSAGRGRLGKAWQSPAGKGLYFSIIVRPRIAREHYPLLTMTTGLGVARAVEMFCRQGVGLKWPNDVLINQKKCAGILAEASIDSQVDKECFAVLGIGLNITTAKADFPQELHNTATSLFLETGRILGGKEVFDRVYATILEHVAMLEQRGFEEVLRQWRQYDILLGKWLHWVTAHKEVVYARSEGVDERGRLLVRDTEGRIREVLSGDVRIAEKK